MFYQFLFIESTPKNSRIEGERERERELEKLQMRAFAWTVFLSEVFNPASNAIAATI